MDGRDLEIAAYIMIQNMTMDIFLILVTYLTMLYMAMERTELDQDLSSGLANMANAFVTYIEMSEKLTNTLVQRLGCDYDASERRRRVNGELMKVPSLSVRDRLRVATLIVSNEPEVDLFLSLPNDLKGEYVRRLLDGDF